LGIGLIYYFGPDAEQDWAWITPGGVAATMLWLLVSLLFKVNVANFTDHEGSYGAVGGVIVLMLRSYVSGIAILTGAELNAEIEHASPYGKAPGQKNAQGKRLIGARAERALREREPFTLSTNATGLAPTSLRTSRSGSGWRPPRAASRSEAESCSSGSLDLEGARVIDVLSVVGPSATIIRRS